MHVCPARTREVWVSTHRMSPIGAVVMMTWKSTYCRTSASREFGAHWEKFDCKKCEAQGKWSKSPSRGFQNSCVGGSSFGTPSRARASLLCLRKHKASIATMLVWFITPCDAQDQSRKGAVIPL